MVRHEHAPAGKDAAAHDVDDFAGNDAIKSGSATVGVGVVVHVALSIAFGVAFSVVSARLRTNGSLAIAGTIFGIALYLVNAAP